MATITDSLFSLIIFIYVMVTFLYLFYGFCWIDTPKKTQAEIEEENKLVGFEDQSQDSRFTQFEWILFDLCICRWDLSLGLQREQFLREHCSVSNCCQMGR